MSQLKKIRLLIADDHLVVRKGLRLLLTPKYGVEIVAEAENGLEAVQLCQQLNPDVCLLDLKMPVLDGLSAARQILSAQPLAAILILTSASEPDQVSQAIEMGVLGYILKDSSAEELIEAIQQVAAGKIFLPKELARNLRAQHKTGATPTASAYTYQLTEREMDVLKLVSQGFTNKQIASHLYLGEVTARFHMSNLMRKLGVKNRGQVIAKALEEHLI